MEPTLMVGDYLIKDYRYAVKPNDVIIIRFPKDPKRKFIERCIAIAGQVVEIKDKSVFVDGEVFPDSQKIQFIVHLYCKATKFVFGIHSFTNGDRFD